MHDKNPITIEDVTTAHAITPLFYEAVLQPEKWPFALEKLKSALGADVAQFIYNRVDPIEVFAAHNVGGSDELYQSWMAFDHSLDSDPRLSKVLNLPNKPVLASQLVPEAEFRGSRIYREVFEPHGYLDSMAVFIPVEEANFTLACGLVNRATSPPFTSRSLEVFQLYVPHLRQVARIAQRINFENELSNMLAAALDQIGLAAMILHGNRRLYYANKRAQGLLERGDVLWASNGIVNTTGHVNRLEFSEAVKSCGYHSHAGQAEKRIDLVLNGTRDSSKPYYVTVSSIEQRFAGAIPGAANPYISMVIINDPEVSCETPAEKLQRLYGLTESEGRIMLAFGSGHSVSEIAGDLNRKDETVRSHLRSVRDKTGIRTKSKMAQIVANLAE